MCNYTKSSSSHIRYSHTTDTICRDCAILLSDHGLLFPKFYYFNLIYAFTVIMLSLTVDL